MNTLLRAFLVLFLVGCGEMPVEDGGQDAAPRVDARTTDARATTDAGPEAASPTADSGTEAATTDAGVPADDAAKPVDADTDAGPLVDAGTDAGPAVDAGPAMRVVLSWDVGPDTDLDLHIHDGTTTPWFNADDCYFANPHTTWGAVLEHDSRTTGPESAVVTPTIGTTYTIGVHHYGGPSRAARIEVSCGGAVVTWTGTSRVMTGFQNANCAPSDFWHVVTVRFTSASTCVVTPVDTYSTGLAACEAF